MDDLERRLAEDRALRDAARTVWRRELEHTRAAIRPAALGERLGDAIGRRIESASDKAIIFAQRHGGKFAAAGGAIAAGIGIWLARGPILARLAVLFSKGETGLPDKAPDSAADKGAKDE